ncbi:ribosomal protein S18-alanine N-acetyltransferase [bacterium]|nr:ribosomal protein S18-alanine N-acetyltransferase [bacterium]
MVAGQDPVERPMDVGDVDQLVAAELRCFPEDPWTGDAFSSILSLPAFHGVVLEEAGRLIGYLVAWEIIDEGELLNIAILPEERGRGLGRGLLKNWLKRLREQRFRAVFLDVRDDNQPAIALYESFGFEVVGKRKGYYSNGEDALEMMLALGDG